MTDLHSAAQRVLDISTELLRLYDYRFELAKMESERDSFLDVGGPAWRLADKKVRPLLSQYGREKKANWEALRPALADLRSALQQPMPAEVLIDDLHRLLNLEPNDDPAARAFMVRCEVERLHSGSGSEYPDGNWHAIEGANGRCACGPVEGCDVRLRRFILSRIDFWQTKANFLERERERTLEELPDAFRREPGSLAVKVRAYVSFVNRDDRSTSALAQPQGINILDSPIGGPVKCAPWQGAARVERSR